MNIYNQITYNNDCSYNYPYNFGYDDVPTKDQELENVPAAAACNYSGNYSSSSSGSPSSNSMGAFETSIGTLSINNPCRPPPSPAATTSFPLPDQADDNYLSQPDFSRVYSSGDLDSVNSYMARRRSQRRAESPLSTSNENSLIIQGCILTATKYTPQEKKERIDRYRYKRNQRNFHKKIQYTCRKTLADSRPRVKGRFVRNDVEAAAAATAEDGNYNTSSGSWYSSSDYEHVVNNVINVGEDDNCEENSWINLLDCSHYF